MQLKKIYIDGYKNLIQTSIELQSTNIPLAIIGNNGSGKSNLMEALLHIFIGLYYNDPPDFDFSLEYEAHNKNVSIIRQRKKNLYSLTVDGYEWSRARLRDVS